MTYKSPKQPLCHCCGKKIPKETETVRFYEEQPLHTGYSTIIVANPLPATKAEAQKLTNKKIVSVARSLNGERVHCVSVWDGESYRDQYFCNRTVCAVAYAYMTVGSVRNHCQSQAYVEAMEKAARS